MTRGGTDVDDQMEVVARRIEFIELLDEEGPLTPRDIVDEVNQSRSTVTRALSELREANLIEKTADGYTATLPAVLSIAVYRRYRTALNAILTSKQLLTSIHQAHALSIDVLVDADTSLAETEFPIRSLETVSDRIREADEVCAYFPTLLNSHLLRVWHRTIVADAVEGRAIFDPDLLTVLKGQYPQMLAEMAAADAFSAFTTSGPPYGIVLTTTQDMTTVSVIVYETENSIRGILSNDAEAAIEWARSEFEHLEGEAVEVTADLDALSTAVTDGIPDPDSARATGDARVSGASGAETAGHALPVALEAEGFGRLSSEYFEAYGQASPPVSWRTGFTLSEVWAGHAVDRLDDEGRNLTDKLVEQLRDGGDRVILGPPGAGKSTICMQVACEWYERGIGPVLYREHGRGDHFDSVALLEAYLRQTEGHTLVVVEDAVRERAVAIFDVMQAMAGDHSVTFLLDARVHEWRNTDEVVVDARRDAYRRTAIDQVDVPSLDERECARFVAHFSDLVDADLDFSGAELYSRVAAGTAAYGGDTGSPGDVLIAQHHLSQWSDPYAMAAEPPTALDEAVHQTYQALTDANVRFASELGVLITMLNAAGVPIAREYLYSLAIPEEYADLDEAIAEVEGLLVFEQDRHQPTAGTTYRTYHEMWALRFLEQVLAVEPTQRAREQFGRCVTRLLALADEPERREQIQRHLGGRTPHLHQIEADTTNWADEVVSRIFAIGRRNASLAPLFGETTGDTISLPTACTAWTTVQQAYWRGEMNRLHGDLEHAEREFRALRERVVSIEEADDHQLEPATTGGTSSHLGSGEAGQAGKDAQRKHWRAVSLTKLGRIAEMRSELEIATEYHEESLALFRELEDSHGEAYALNHLGIVAGQRGEFEAAEEYHEAGLALFRELADRHGEAYALGTRGIVARRRGELETAAEYLEESIVRYRDAGDRRREAWALDNRGLVAREQGEIEKAVEYYEESLAMFRNLGARRGVARALNNLGEAVHHRGEPDTATEYVMESLSLYREIGNRRGEAKAHANLGEIAHNHGQLEQARSQFAAAADQLITIGADGATTALVNVIDVCEQQGDLNAARDWCRRGIEFANETDQGDLHDGFDTRLENLTDNDGTSSRNS